MVVQIIARENILRNGRRMDDVGLFCLDGIKYSKVFVFEETDGYKTKLDTVVSSFKKECRSLRNPQYEIVATK